MTAYEELAPDGTVLSRRAFAAFDVIGGRVAPRQVILASPPDALEVTIEHRQLTLDPDVLAFPFHRPDDVETIRLD